MSPDEKAERLRICKDLTVAAKVAEKEAAKGGGGLRGFQNVGDK
jgi:hypothetical protein